MNNYTHVQATPARIWSVAHNLATYPVTDVTITLNGVDQKILPLSVVYVDENNLEVYFTDPRQGFVRVLGSYKFEFAQNGGDTTDPAS